ncbi:MAG TPA: FtsH protease activity modulator HflK [Pseudomonadales bacterium]|jgi:membrane protease subunit HflK|nr:FtsH protease activity modulator HflK [Gammaproteobacteria bacterium]MDP6025588.1 FtsH protease activity modulator HflK [Pseudomonadales bacterium]MDP6315210.1 FtsH protease activity modulator HflK [Pseudomonadales bacterium]MDP7314371.1 FtsH protease activity modulator HflK [Pseudomonadales bacterium]HJL61630.1 FtsH protease activity modulator HflK [Pseudomonadales bacterium]|tara:strand:- start:3196 stop:4344 length:1149 start_codon:yes stop_codon:yes gene_type:complete
MAWNEPGGGNQDGKDPWGNRDDQGPPDLDEAFRKLRNNLTAMFGGKGSSSGGGGSPAARINGKIFGWLLLALLLVWGFMGAYTIDQQERGVVLRFGNALDEVVLPGLHWNPPGIDVVLRDNVTRVRDILVNSDMLTEDENIVKVAMTVQYVIEDIEKYLLRVRNPNVSLRQATESALRHEVGGAIMNDVLTEGRAELGDKVRIRIQQYMDRYGTGIQVTQVNIDETAPPDAVRAAFDDVIKAREDEVRVRNEADAYANQIVPEARGEAQKYIEEAEGYKQRVIAEARGEAERFNKLYAEYTLAPVVTRERLYLDTIESVMLNSTKVMLDVDGGNNLLYIPLDKIMESTGSTSNRSGNFSNAPSTNNERVDTNRRSASRRDRN